MALLSNDTARQQHSTGGRTAVVLRPSIQRRQLPPNSEWPSSNVTKRVQKREKERDSSSGRVDDGNGNDDEAAAVEQQMIS